MTRKIQKPSLKDASAKVSATGFLDYRAYLNALYAQLKSSVERYSYVQFADEMGFSKTNVLHLVVTGKRPLTVKGALKLSQALSMSSRERDYFLTLVAYQNEPRSSRREELFAQLLSLKKANIPATLERFQLEYFSAWYHPVIREMTLMRGFRSDPEWIATRITPRIRPEQARKSIRLLETLNLIRFDSPLGRHVPVDTHVSTGAEVDSIAVVGYHRESISLGREAISSVDETRRDISAITVCVSEDTARRLKQEVQAFRKRMLEIVESADDGDQIYQLNMQLFPLTKGEENKP